MKSLTRFEITGLHGYRDIAIPIEDNTLILVGENGTGKTTILRILYFLLSGQWTALAAYEFDSIHVQLGDTPHTLTRTEITKHFRLSRHPILRRVPPPVRHRILSLAQRSESPPLRELERLCVRYDLPFSVVLEELAPSQRSSLSKSIASIRTSLGATVLYLPTYRRIEHELQTILAGLDERELPERWRRSVASSRSVVKPFVELVEFGMRDVEAAIDETRAELDQFASERLNNLTIAYLDDIVEQKDKSLDLQQIVDADPETIDTILARIQEPILSSSNKEHLKEIIERVRSRPKPDVRSTLICHYFTKLMAFHGELQLKESKIAKFCEACNRYMVDKEFKYSTSNFAFSIKHDDAQKAENPIELRDLSSGEKQIVSIFCHLYLSKQANYFVLIDEPELSLSVTWQRTFLTDIRDGSFCMGLVATTHSPFIYDNHLNKYARGLGEF